MISRVKTQKLQQPRATR